MIYLKQLNPYTGGLIPSLLFYRVYFLYTTVNRPFYKFISPCDHPLYRKGKNDSWTEELDITRHILNSTLKKVGTKLKRGQHYDLTKCNLVLYWAGGHGMTYFIPNYPKLMTLGLDKAFLKKHFPHFLNWKSQLPKSEKRIFEIRFVPSQHWNFGLSYNHNKTQSKTHHKTQEGDFPFSLNNSNAKIEESEKEKSCAQKEKEELIMPYSSERFKNIYSEWTAYSKEEFGFVYNHKKAQSLLYLIQDYDEEFVIQLMIKAMASGWRSFVFPDTPQKFQKYLKAKSYGTTTAKNGEQFESHVAAIFEKY